MKEPPRPPHTPQAPADARAPQREASASEQAALSITLLYGALGLSEEDFRDCLEGGQLNGKKMPPRRAFGLLPPEGALLALGRPGGKKKAPVGRLGFAALLARLQGALGKWRRFLRRRISP